MKCKFVLTLILWGLCGCGFEHGLIFLSAEESRKDRERKSFAWEGKIGSLHGYIDRYRAEGVYGDVVGINITKDVGGILKKAGVKGGPFSGDVFYGFESEDGWGIVCKWEDESPIPEIVSRFRKFLDRESEILCEMKTFQILVLRGMFKRKISLSVVPQCVIEEDK